MRIHIYNEEINFDRKPEIVTKTADTGLTFHGLRFWMKPDGNLHADPADDDTTAVTFWFDNEHRISMLSLIGRAAHLLATLPHGEPK